MKNIFITLLLIFTPIFAYSQVDYRKTADSLKYVTEIPYIHNCNDSVFWSIVSKGPDIVPYLIDKMSDTKKLEGNYAPFCGGEYTVGDAAYIAIEEIIEGIPSFDLLGIEISEECGHCSFWYHLRENKKNRRTFQSLLRRWYNDRQYDLIWVESRIANTGDCFANKKGHYKARLTDEEFITAAIVSKTTTNHIRPSSQYPILDPRISINNASSASGLTTELPYPLHILEDMDKLSEYEFSKYEISDNSPVYALRKMNVPASSVHELYINSAICDTITNRVDWNEYDSTFWRTMRRKSGSYIRLNINPNFTTIGRPIFDNDQNYAIIAVSNNRVSRSTIDLSHTQKFNFGATYVYKKTDNEWVVLGSYDGFFSEDREN